LGKEDLGTLICLNQNGLINPLKGFTVYSLHLKFGNFIKWTPRQAKYLFKKSRAE
jgi:hypothetical protein